MFAFIVSYVFYGFNMFHIDSLAVFLNSLYLIVSDDGRREPTCCLFLSSNISWISELNDDYYDRTDYCNQGQWLSCSVKHSCADLCVIYSQCHRRSKNVEKCLVCTLQKGSINFNQTCTDISLGNAERVDKILVTLTPFSRSQEVKEC